MGNIVKEHLAWYGVLVLGLNPNQKPIMMI